MLTQTEILRALDERGVRPVQIGRALDATRPDGHYPSSRVAEIRKGRRRLTLDEAVRLVEVFDLENERPPRDPLPLPIARLAVKHVARALGVPVPDDLLQTVAAALQALAALAGQPGAREALHSLEMFLDGLNLRSTGPAEFQQSDHSAQA